VDPVQTGAYVPASNPKQRKKKIKSSDGAWARGAGLWATEGGPEATPARLGVAMM